MSQFSMGRAVRIIEHSESKYSPQEIVLRARSRLGENEYQVLRNNCEHFCNWCITGRSRSTQAESPLASTLQALVVAVHCAKRLPLVLRKALTLFSSMSALDDGPAGVLFTTAERVLPQ